VGISGRLAGAPRMGHAIIGREWARQAIGGAGAMRDWRREAIREGGDGEGQDAPLEGGKGRDRPLEGQGPQEIGGERPYGREKVARDGMCHYRVRRAVGGAGATRYWRREEEMARNGTRHYREGRGETGRWRDKGVH